MTSGFKDWETQVNISGQELSAVLARTYLGYSSESSSTKAVGVGETIDILELSTSGIVLGGYIEISGGESRISDEFSLGLDYHSSKQWKLTTLLGLSITVPGVSHMYLIKYDNINFDYVVGFSPGRVFDESLIVRYVNCTGVLVYIKTLLAWGRTLR